MDFSVSEIYSAKSSDNVFTGEPAVDCLPENVQISFQTMQSFTGHVYVRGHYDSSDCHNDYELSKDTIVVMQIPFSKCGMRRQRSANPKGLSMVTTLIISFHRMFVTAMDRAFNVQCFYVEDDQIVTQNMDVSHLPTTNVESNPVMPTCTYHVMQGGRSGTVVSHGRVGDKVFHRWLCVYPMQEMYCMTVHSCTVDDGEGELFTVIDEQGCSKDQFILDDLNYISDMEAGVDSHIFKFADKSHIYFTCQIRFVLKREQPSHVCPRPICAVKYRSRRHKRTSSTHASEPIFGKEETTDIDLMAPPIMVLDLDEQPEDFSWRKLQSREEPDNLNSRPIHSLQQNQICLLPFSFAIFLTTFSLLTLTLLTFFGYLIFCYCPNRLNIK